MQQAMQGALDRVRADASRQIDAMAEQLRKVQAELANRTMQINRDADTRVEAERIKADANVRVAEIQAASNKAMDHLMGVVDELRAKVEANTPKRVAAEPATPTKQEKAE